MRLRTKRIALAALVVRLRRFRIVCLGVLLLAFTSIGKSSLAQPLQLARGRESHSQHAIRPPVYKTEQEDVQNGIFSDLSPTHDGGVANPTDGSTGHVLQQTLIDAYLWSASHGNARPIVIVASEYPILGHNIWIPTLVRMTCSAYAPTTYTGGCVLFSDDPGNDTATGGSTLLIANYAYGMLSDQKTICTLYDPPQKPGCTIIGSDGGSIDGGFTLFGGGPTAGGKDIGIFIAANNFSVKDTEIVGFFGGPGIAYGAGFNVDVEWNYGTNVDTWWCNNPTQLTGSTINSALPFSDGALGGLDVGLVDGFVFNNQYSTGCAFAKGFRASLEYTHIAAIHIFGSGTFVQGNLAQDDTIGLLVGGQEQRVIGNRAEYTAREALSSYASKSLFLGNHIVSPCLDPNLARLRPGSPNGGIPSYPSDPAPLARGALFMDSNGNVEQVIASSGSGLTDSIAPDWPGTLGAQTLGTNEIYQLMGPWIPGLTDSTLAGLPPAMTSGLCYGNVDNTPGNVWSSNVINIDAGVNGPSYLRGSYYLNNPASVVGNECAGDQPDPNGNGQCYWGGDLFSNGGPQNLQPNEQMITASGGGTAWVGDYSVLSLTDEKPVTYNNFQGMSDETFFWVMSTTAANIIQPWGDNGSGSLYGHPSLYTCGGVPLVTVPNVYYEFYYHLANQWAITEVGCNADADTGSQVAAISLSPQTLTFPTQIQNVPSIPQVITLTNPGNALLSMTIATVGDYAESTLCGNSLAPGDHCAISIVFTPQSVGYRSGAMIVGNNDDGTSHVVPLIGAGSAVPSTSPNLPPSDLSVSPIDLTFSPQVVGTESGTQTITVGNNSGMLHNIAIEVAGDFAQTNTCGSGVAPNSTCAAYITSSPTVTGLRAGSLSIGDNTNGLTQTVALIGSGLSPVPALPLVTPFISLSSSSSSITLSSAGGAVSAPIAIAAGGGFAGDVSLTCMVTYQGQSAPSTLPTCSLSPSQLQLEATGVAYSSLSIVTPVVSAAVIPRHIPPVDPPLLSGTLWLCLFSRKHRKRKGAWTTLLLMVLSIGLVGCGSPSPSVLRTLSGAPNPTQPAATQGSYNVEIKGSSGSVVASTTLAFIVQ